MSLNKYPIKTVHGVKKRLHRHVMENYLGRPLEPCEHVYHVNGDSLDNRIENLVVIVKKDSNTMSPKEKYQEIKSDSEGLRSGSKKYRKGVCTIIVSPPLDNHGWSMIVSTPYRDPTCLEIREAWCDLIPDSDKKIGAIFLYPKDHYLSVERFCFHIHEVLNR